jgi:anti-sigma regulatory factor (Ser/Thr protein kinase)
VTRVPIAELLASNAVRHGAEPITLDVECRDDRVRVTVSDRSPAPPILGRG